MQSDARGRELLRRRLVGCHFQVETVPNGTEALARMARFRPHLVVTDLNRPHRDTYELLEQLSRRPATRRIPVIALAAGGQGMRLNQVGPAVLVAESTTFATVLEGIRNVLRTHPEALAHD